MDPVSLFITLVVIGLFMLAVEVIVPGGIVGAIGFIALLAACVMAFSAFGAKNGILATVTIMLGSVIILALWIRFLPYTPVGKAITLNVQPPADEPRPFSHDDLLEKIGETVTELRPSGFARIEGKRVDVITDQDWIEIGQKVKVVKVESNRIVVRAC